MLVRTGSLRVISGKVIRGTKWRSRDGMNRKDNHESTSVDSRRCMAERREKNVGGEGTLQDMYERSEKEGPGCHGHSVKIKYRLGRGDGSFRLPPPGPQAGSLQVPPTPLYPEVLA